MHLFNNIVKHEQSLVRSNRDVSEPSERKRKGANEAVAEEKVDNPEEVLSASDEEQEDEDIAAAAQADVARSLEERAARTLAQRATRLANNVETKAWKASKRALEVSDSTNHNISLTSPDPKHTTTTNNPHQNNKTNAHSVNGRAVPRYTRTPRVYPRVRCARRDCFQIQDAHLDLVQSVGAAVGVHLPGPASSPVRRCFCDNAGCSATEPAHCHP